ncbi:MAG: SMC-Scp complex subunit ScpB [Microbacteriaceae bacterium]
MTNNDAVDAAPVSDETSTEIRAGQDETAAEETLTAAESALVLNQRLEAILMVVDEPISVVNLATASKSPVAATKKALAALKADYDGQNGTVARGFELREVGGGWRFYVRAEFDELVSDYVFAQNPSKLSQAALETLAVIAYRQPISRGSIAAIRAVNVDSVVRTLLSRGLITEEFTDPETGAIHYVTTELLLSQLGINSLDELPALAPLLPDAADQLVRENLNTSTDPDGRNA